MTDNNRNEEKLCSVAIKISGDSKIKLGTVYGEELLKATERGDIQTIRGIMSLSVDEGGPRLLRLFAEDKRGNSALHLAVIRGYKNIVEYLLEQGLRANMKNNDGKTSIDCAIDSRNQEIMEELKKCRFPDKYALCWMEYEFVSTKYEKFIYMYGTDNWMGGAICHNSECKYETGGLCFGISGLYPHRGFFAPALCQQCKEVVSVVPDDSGDTICEKCGKTVELYSPYIVHQPPFKSEINLICPKCGNKTLQFITESGATWD